MEILSTKIRKAKKTHHCNFCNGVITVGEQYEARAIKFDNEFYTWKSHIRCSKIANKLNMYDECEDGVTADDFQEIVMQEYINLQIDKENYPFPEFQEMLNFVCNHHRIEDQEKGDK
jgi:hypothetical protein